MSEALRLARVVLALCAGGIAGGLLVPAVFTFDEPNGWSLWGAASYLAYSAAASFVTLPTAVVAGAFAYPLLRFLPPALHPVSFAVSGVLAAGVLCVATSPAESIVKFMIVGAASAIVAFLLLPRSSNTVERDARNSAARPSP